MPENDFVASSFPMVIIPYKEYEKMINVVHEVEAIKAQNARILEQYTSIRGMFSECLEKIANIERYVTD